MPDQPAPHPSARQTRNEAFPYPCAQTDARLVEVGPAAGADGAAALGFTLAWAITQRPAWLFWATPDHGLIETGVPYAEGLAHVGLDLDSVLLALTRTQADALWAAEQALTLPGACVLCTVAAAPKPLSLTATRRLLLAAEKHGSRCILLRFDAAGASAAWLRWSISAAPSEGARRELGAPSFYARLMRNRAGPAGDAWRFEWDAYARSFRSAKTALAVDLAAASRDRSDQAHIRRAV